jgi:hypothetical protein
LSRPCLSWVNMSRHGSAMARPVYPQQRTYLMTAGMAVSADCVAKVTA